MTEKRLNVFEAPGPKEKWITRNFNFLPSDMKQLDYIQRVLGGSRADAIRSAIRVYAALLAQMHGNVD